MQLVVSVSSLPCCLDLTCGKPRVSINHSGGDENYRKFPIMYLKLFLYLFINPNQINTRMPTRNHKSSIPLFPMGVHPLFLSSPQKKTLAHISLSPSYLDMIKHSRRKPQTQNQKSQGAPCHTHPLTTAPTPSPSPPHHTSPSATLSPSSASPPSPSPSTPPSTSPHNAPTTPA